VLSTSRFGRGDECLQLEQRETAAGMALQISGTDGTRSFAFPDLDALLQFQSDMEQFLVRTGWTLLDFVPDRRRYTDRRGFPRVACDRRRWWTDPLRRQP
jgi:hypothetical protein